MSRGVLADCSVRVNEELTGPVFTVSLILLFTCANPACALHIWALKYHMSIWNGRGRTVVSVRKENRVRTKSTDCGGLYFSKFSLGIC